MKEKIIGLIGLGKMGSGIARNLKEHGWSVVVYNRTKSVTEAFVAEGFAGAYSYQELLEKLPAPKLVWLMLPAGEAVETTVFGANGLASLLSAGDYLIEGGNSYYKNTQSLAERLSAKGIKALDAGVSGGPSGARTGACVMVGGQEEDFKYLEQLFSDIAVPNGYKFFAGHGAGHFVKMVHNGIEYGMMQAIAEGFSVLKASPYKLNLEDVVGIYSQKSVISSRLIDWLGSAYKEFGQELENVSGTVAHTGEGAWTVDTATELGLPVANIAQSLQFRKDSEQNPSYTGKVLSALRNQFGGHDASSGLQKDQ